MTGQELIKKLKKKIYRTGIYLLMLKDIFLQSVKYWRQNQAISFLHRKAEVLMICTIRTIWKDIFQNGSRSFQRKKQNVSGSCVNLISMFSDVTEATALRIATIRLERSPKMHFSVLKRVRPGVRDNEPTAYEQ